MFLLSLIARRHSYNSKCSVCMGERERYIKRESEKEFSLGEFHTKVSIFRGSKRYKSRQRKEGGRYPEDITFHTSTTKCFM